MVFDLLGGFDGGAWGEDAGDLAFDEFTGLCRFDLVADSDFFSCTEEFIDIVFAGVVGDAGHGHAVAGGEGDAHDGGGFFGVFEEEFIEVAEAEEEEGIWEEFGAYLEILLHHGGGGGVGGVWVWCRICGHSFSFSRREWRHSRILC